MKKVLVLLLAILTILPSASLADDSILVLPPLDIGSYYKVGKDIPAGEYTASCIDGTYVLIAITDASHNFLLEATALAPFKENKEIDITLNNDNFLMVSLGSLRLTKLGNFDASQVAPNESEAAISTNAGEQLEPVHAFAASIDLSTMTFDELVALRGEIDLAIWATEEWQEVKVPVGVYEIGSDIPDGHWLITAGKGQWPHIKWGNVLDEAGKDIPIGKGLYSNLLLDPAHASYDNYSGKYPNSVDLELTDGTYLVIDSGFVIFTPFAGKPSLGFK